LKTSGHRKFLILVADQEGSVFRSLQLALSGDGHRLRLVGNDQEALAVLNRVKFDLVIADRALVGILANELAARIKQKWPDLPIIMTSAFALDFNLAGTTFCHVDYVLDKSFNQNELREAINLVLARAPFMFPNPSRLSSRGAGDHAASANVAAIRQRWISGRLAPANLNTVR
jgi:DNA-binding response OmpR family regulator